MSLAARLRAAATPAAADPEVPARPAVLAGVLRDSPLWLVAVAVVYMLTELSPMLLHMPLGPDEITYIAQTSVQHSAVMLPPVHSRGPALLAAPVTLLTSSLLTLRIWMALLSGIGLLLAMLCWRGVRRDWVIATAGLILSSLGIAELSGVQAMPDWWVALGAIAVIGLFLRAVSGQLRPALALPLLGFATFFLFLQRMQDAVFLIAPLMLAIVLVPAWRNIKVLTAIFAGAAAAVAEWVGESYAFYGGVLSRLHMMKQEPPKLAIYFTLPYQLRVLNGPWYCKPHQCHQWDYRWMTIWWVALVALAVAGVLAARRTARLNSSLVVLASAVSLLLAYTLFVPYATPRYLLPVIALLIIPAADGIFWLPGAVARRWRALAIAGIVAFLLGGMYGEHLVKTKMASGQDITRADFTLKASLAQAAGVGPPCVDASPSIAYYLGCSAPYTGQATLEILMTHGGVGAWRQVSGLLTPVFVPQS
ncbi:MAG TPA: hypothetical protein VH637_21095 [Streptosporangiaceae bacterium]|jgi:hypothetical protein